MSGLDQKLHDQQAANRKLQRKYETIKGDLRKRQRDSEVLAQMRRLPTLANLINELEYVYDHKDDPPPPERSREEIAAALDRAYWPFWRRWLWRRTRAGAGAP